MHSVAVGGDRHSLPGSKISLSLYIYIMSALTVVFEREPEVETVVE